MGAMGPPDEQVPPQANGHWHGGPRLTTDEPFSRSQFANMPPPKAALGFPKSVGAHASSQPGGPTADPIQHPAEYIRLVFDLVVATDKEGYFLRPVDESVAPNYYKQIKQPLCFADMRDKLESGIYTSYKAIMTDFDLIVSNAKTFNKEKTKCYKCASTLSRNIAKIMSTHEIGMRKAFSVLHPGTIPGSAGFGSTSNKGTPNLMDTSDMTSAGTSSAQATGGQSRGGLLGDLPIDPRDRPGEAAVRQQSIKAEPPVTTGPSGHVALRIKRPVPPPPQPPPASISLPPIRLEPLCKAYSDNEEEDQRLVLHHHRQAQEGQPSAQCRKLVPLEALMAGLRQAATFQPWAGLQDNQGSGTQAQGGPGAAGASGTAALPATVEQGNQQEGAISPPAAQPDTGQDIPGQADDWRLVQGSIEWQCHWLQLRMRELQAQMGRLAGSSDAGQQQPGQAATVVTSNGGGCSGSSAAVAAELAERKRQLTAAAARHSQGGPTAPLLPANVAQSRLHIPVAHCPLASTTFFAGRPASAGTATSTQHVSGTPATDTPLQPLMPVDGDVEMTDAVGAATAGPCAQTMASNSMTAAGSPAEGPSAMVGAAASQLAATSAEHVSTAAAPGVTLATTALDATASHSGIFASQPSAAASVLAAIPDSQLPAAVFASLETIEMQLMDVKRGLQAAFALDRGRARAGVSRTGAGMQLGSAASGAAAASAPGAAGLLRRPSSVVRPFPPPRTSSLANMGSFKSGSEPASKRKRTDGEAEMQPYFSRSLDRPSASIYIPEIRELCQEEVQARMEAVAHGAGTWHEAYKTQGAIALDHPPPVIASALAACSDEGSSSEDTSDEAYATMHAIMAEEERKRFAAAAVEGQRRRNKQQSKTAPAAQQPASAGQGGPSTVPASGPSGPTRRHSYGIKAPRPASTAQLPLSPQITQQALVPPAEGLGLDRPKHHHHHHHPPVPPAPADRSLPVQRAAQSHPPAPPIHTRRSPPAAPAAPTTHPHQQAIMRVLSINTGHTPSHSVPAVVLVPTSTPTSVPAVATAPHPFILQTAGSLLPGLMPAPGLRRSSSGVPSSAPSHPPRPPSNPGSNPAPQLAPTPSQPSVPAITPPGHITTRGSSPRVAVAAAATAVPAPQPPVVAPLPPPQPPAATAPQPRRTPRRPATTPAPLPTPSPPPSSSNDDDTRQGHSGSRGPSTEADDKDQSGSGSQESSESESDTSQEGDEGEEDSESGSDESESGDSSGSSDGTRDGSDDDGDDEGDDDRADQSSGGGAAPRKRRADRQTSQPRRSSGGGARHPAVANGSSARNGRRSRGATDLGKKVVVRMTRSQDQGKLRSSRSTAGGGVAKPARTPSHGGAAPPRRR